MTQIKSPPVPGVSHELIMDEALEKLSIRQQELSNELELINRTIQHINSLRNSITSNNSKGISQAAIPITPEIIKMEDGKGYDFFLWAIERLNNEATASDVVKEVSKLSLDLIRNRIADNSLTQWLTVGGDTLCKRNVLVKIPRGGRKGGVIYKKK